MYREKRSSAPAERFSEFGTGKAGEDGSRDKPSGGFTDEQGISEVAKPPVDAKTLALLCPEFAAEMWAPAGATWETILRHVEAVAKPHLQLPDSIWRAAIRILGRERAAATVALIFEKYQAGLVDNPGAYLNGMVTKAANNELHLPSSLFHWRKAGKTTPQTERRHDMN